MGELTDKGELDFVGLPRLRTHRNQDASGLFRWYNEYVLPELYGRKHLMVRLYNNEEDAARKFNRTENVRPIPASDPDFKSIYSRRSDSESINRGLEDTLYLNRAHSVGHARQHVNLLGYALMVNSLALPEHRQRQRLVSRAWAASLPAARSGRSTPPSGPRDPEGARSPKQPAGRPG